MSIVLIDIVEIVSTSNSILRLSSVIEIQHFLPDYG